MVEPADAQEAQRIDKDEQVPENESRSLVVVPEPSPGYEELKPDNSHAVELTDGIDLSVWPRTRVTRDQFITHFPPYSMAFDGFVPTAPEYVEEGPYRIFNHHEGVDPDCTRANCAQVHVATKRGVWERFQRDGVPHAHIYVEDPDQDVCYSCWLAQNHERIVGLRSEPLLNRLLFLEDLQDSAAGMYPFDPTNKAMRQMAWIFEPYVLARLDGRLREMGGSEMANIILTVGENITKYSIGEGGTRELDTRYEVIGGGEGWTMTREHGFYARAAYLCDNIKAFIAVQDNPDGTHSYSIGRASTYIPFPLGQELYEALNMHESTPCWGGGRTIGGSRGGEGSQQTPEQVAENLNLYLTRCRETLPGNAGDLS